MTEVTDASAPVPPCPEGISVHDHLALLPDGMGALSDKLGIELKEASANRLVATMPVAGNTQPYGLLHGGATVALAETLGSIGSAIHGHPDRAAVGVDINATHHRGPRAGTLVTGIATAVHLGRTMATYQVAVVDENDKRICSARITCALVPKSRVT